jgi:hypothetical protein
MIGITPNKNWDLFAELFSEDILDRLNFFYFEFGRKMTYAIHSNLLGRISKIKGPKDYKKRIIVAELRDVGGRSWWAIIAQAKTISQREYDPKQSILTVVPRFEVDIENPLESILVEYGPWTPETLPFVPSPRQAAVVLKKATSAQTDVVRRKNISQMEAIQARMMDHDLEFESREAVYTKLKVVQDLEIEAMRIEFGVSANSKAHWRPAINWGGRVGLDQLEKDKDLIRIMTDLSYKGYKLKKHAKYFLTPSELKALEKFQDKVRLG